MMDDKDQLFDVVIYNRETRVIDTIAGTRLRRSSADRRLLMMLSRMNDHYGAAIVESGKYVNGDTLADTEEENIYYDPDDMNRIDNDYAAQQRAHRIAQKERAMINACKHWYRTIAKHGHDSHEAKEAMHPIFFNTEELFNASGEGIADEVEEEQEP